MILILLQTIHIMNQITAEVKRERETPVRQDGKLTILFSLAVGGGVLVECAAWKKAKLCESVFFSISLASCRHVSTTDRFIYLYNAAGAAGNLSQKPLAMIQVTIYPIGMLTLMK